MPRRATTAELDAWVLDSAPRAVAYAISLLRDRAQAEDVVQDCYCRLLDKQARYDLPRDGTKLLFRSISNACINLSRRRRVLSLHGNERDDTDWAPEDFKELPPLEGVLHRELADAVAAGLAQLPVQHRAALELKSLGHSQQEIAEMLGITASNAGVLVHRARQQMAKFLAPLLEERVE